MEFPPPSRDGINEIQHLHSQNGKVPGTNISMSPASVMRSVAPFPSFFGGRNRIISSGVINGRSM